MVLASIEAAQRALLEARRGWLSTTPVGADHRSSPVGAYSADLGSDGRQRVALLRHERHLVLVRLQPVGAHHVHAVPGDG